jgi:alpha-ribazole phosphatase
MQVYLIRHPKPNTAADLCYGRQDVPVDATSVAHAAMAVRERIPEPVLNKARIFSSPSSRCVLLARELAAPREPRIAEDLMEMSFGSWEGQPWDAAPRDELDAWASDVWRYKPGGAESAAMVAARWQRWTTAVRFSGDDAAIAVTHAGVIRVALALADLPNAAALLQVRVVFGSVHCVDLVQAPVIA